VIRRVGQERRRCGEEVDIEKVKRRVRKNIRNGCNKKGQGLGKKRT
jgi:hypothetical protein